VQQQEWELAQTHRTKVTLSLSLLSVALQGGPLPSANTRALCGRIFVRLILQVCPCPSLTSG
jgi:hypothetical protein